MSNYEQPIDREFDWDDTIENDHPDFILLPEGDYDFLVESFERGRHSPKENGKLPPCNKATLNLRIPCAQSKQGYVVVQSQLFLHSSAEGKLCSFFTSIGQRKKGEPLRMNWNAVTGARGRCKIAHRLYNGEQYNEVKRFLEPAAPAPASAQPAFTPGAF